jgi:tetratricopeptide (TPR) repeat protein/O-antigen ligase
MPSRLSRYCEKVMEAAWLAAVILIPVFFNVFSSRIFEPDKIAILRSLALLIVGCWVVKTLADGGLKWKVFHPQEGESWFRALLRVPLLLPVLALVVVYLISTAFSLVPRTSLLGSYQRLQGTYTTFSYLVVFAAMAIHIRSRQQVERLITTLILASLPIALYGILQHYKLDPIPWGGDTSTRIAANMGNSIFVAAYLIMVFPFTVARILFSFREILNDSGLIPVQFVRATLYVFIGAVQIIALYMSGSRGPVLGWMAGLVFIAFVMTIFWRKRLMAFAMIGLILVVTAFLGVFNIPNGPLEGLKDSSLIGRFGLLLDAESNSALVRKYIWEGAVKLVSIHPPLQYPDGSTDRFNFLRPLVGYGPESMYVAYNEFYIPALGSVERRNASPDRSHNETWDSMVTTGVLGLLVYIALYTSVFYFGLKWLGLLGNRHRRFLFFGLYSAGGIIGLFGLSLWRGIEYAGVGLPFGLFLGLMVYVAYAALFPEPQEPKNAGETARFITLMVLVAAVGGHFLEINFGIAIAVTNLYFWIDVALLILLGYILPRYNAYQEVGVIQGAPARRTANGNREHDTRKKRAQRRAASRGSGERPAWLNEALFGAFILTVLLVTLGFDYITNNQGGSTSSAILSSSLTGLRRAGGLTTSYGILLLLVFSWLGCGALLASEGESAASLDAWTRTLAVVLGVSLLIGLIFMLSHAGYLASLAGRAAANLNDVISEIQAYEGILTRFYVVIFLLVFVGAVFLPVADAGAAGSAPFGGWLPAGVGAAVLLLVFYLTSYTNLRVIQADIAFKLADSFTQNNQWPVAIAIYNRANELAPAEDYYYLFLGRAYLEEARTISDASQRDQVIVQAESDLKKAQALNPLNTDHTANLARLYSLWASLTTDPTLKQQRAQTSSQYFQRAVVLSPQNSRLWDEWAVLYLNILNQPDQALQRLNHSLQVDPSYDWTYALLGDYYINSLNQVSDPQQKQEILVKAASLYQKAIPLVKYYENQNLYSYYLSLGSVSAQLNRIDQAIDAYTKSLPLLPQQTDRWRVEETIARLYLQKGDVANAMVHAQNAYNQAPSDQKSRLQTLISQIQG